MDPLVLLVFLFNLGTVAAIAIGCLGVGLVIEEQTALNISLVVVCILAVAMFMRLRAITLIMIARQDAYCEVEIPEEGYVRLEDSTFIGRNETGGLHISNVEPKDHWDAAGEIMEEHLQEKPKLERKEQMKNYYQEHKEQWKVYRKRARDKKKSSK